MHQFAIVHVLSPSLDVYSCPLAMTDGAARTLLGSGNQALIERYVPLLTSRDPARDVDERPVDDRAHRRLRRLAERDRRAARTATSGASTAPSGSRRRPPSQMALTLARPEGNPDGSRGLALFLVELRDANGRLRNIAVNRLKDKLGTRKVPTAELTLDGTPATLVGASSDGVRAITPMLARHAHVERGLRGQRDAPRARARR